MEISLKTQTQNVPTQPTSCIATDTNKVDAARARIGHYAVTSVKKQQSACFVETNKQCSLRLAVDTEFASIAI